MLENPAAQADRKRTDQSFFVPVQKVIDNDWNLSFNRCCERIWNV